MTADLGVSTIRMLQLTPHNEAISIASEHHLGQEGPFDAEAHLHALEAAMPSLLANAPWNGRRMLICMPAPLVTMTQIKLGLNEDISSAVQARLPDLGSNPMIRTINLARSSQSATGARSLMCMIMPRDYVLRYVGVLHQNKVDIGGVFAPASMLIRAFRHVNRRDEDDTSATMYVNLGQAVTTVVFGHGAHLALARAIGVADLAQGPCDPQPATDREESSATSFSTTGGIMTAINRRTGKDAPTMPPIRSAAATSAPTELCDELRMCVRHHQSLFHETPVERIVFTGNGAKDAATCKAIAQSLQLPAQIGDPLARWRMNGEHAPCKDWAEHVRPEWTGIAGLAATALDEGTAS